MGRKGAAAALATDVFRAFQEIGSLIHFDVRSSLLHTAPKGKGQPVIVYPGFTANDASTFPLRRFLESRSYKPYTWQGLSSYFQPNPGPLKSTLRQMRRHFNHVAERHSGQKLILIGHSLGGVYAREMARENPDRVSHVITLGSPFGTALAMQGTNRFVRHLFERFHPDAAGHYNSQEVADILLTPPPVPTTSIYSRDDPVVPWKASINPHTPLSENVEVSFCPVRGPRKNWAREPLAPDFNAQASHVGLIYNPLAYVVIADRLAQSAVNWRPFNPEDHSGFTKYFRKDQAHLVYTPPLPQLGERHEGIKPLQP